MRIILNGTAEAVALEDVDDLKRLDAVVTGGDAIGTIDGVRRSDGDHVWFDIVALKDLAGPRPDQWHSEFAGMIAYATSKGWVDDELNTVRVHISTRNSD